MSFEFRIEPDITKKLNKEDENEIVKQIAGNFDTYNNARIDNLKNSELLINEIFFKNTFKEETDKTKRWKAKVKMAKLYMFYQVLKAFIWKNTYSTINSMFDVSGENADSDNDSNLQKAMLVDILEKMEYQKTCDKVIDNALIYGELISFTAWQKLYEEYRRPIEFFKNLFLEDVDKLPIILKAIASGQQYWIDTRKIYDNPYIFDVSPANFVFDVSQTNNWDNCPKIYKTYKIPDDIIQNKLYKISKEIATDLRNIALPPEQSELSNQSDEQLKDKTSNGNTLEVLEHWGNFRLADGTVLKNWHAVIIARKYLVRFCKNEALINPFTYGTFILDPITKRGISPLLCVLNLALTQEDLINRTYDMQSLTENPPLLAPKGYFTLDELELYPGKIIEFDENLDPTQKITPLQFNSSIFLNDIAFLNDLMSEVSGIFPSMAGADEERAKTATEITTKTNGQMTRLQMFLDTISQYFIIPDVKNVAKLCANFKSGIEQLFLNKDNKKQILNITDEVRQGDYKYTYSDRMSTVEKVTKADDTIMAIQQFAQAIPLNFKEIFTWFMEQKGVENPERFLQQEMLPDMTQQQQTQVPIK